MAPSIRLKHWCIAGILGSSRLRKCLMSFDLGLAEQTLLQPSFRCTSFTECSEFGMEQTVARFALWDFEDSDRLAKCLWPRIDLSLGYQHSTSIQIGSSCCPLRDLGRQRDSLSWTWRLVMRSIDGHYHGVHQHIASCCCGLVPGLNGRIQSHLGS